MSQTYFCLLVRVRKLAKTALIPLLLFPNKSYIFWNILWCSSMLLVVRKPNSGREASFSCQVYSLFLTLHGRTKQKWKQGFNASVKSFYGFDAPVFISLACNSIHNTLLFAPKHKAIWGRLRDDFRLFRRWFDANRMEFQREYCSLFA